MTSAFNFYYVENCTLRIFGLLFFNGICPLEVNEVPLQETSKFFTSECDSVTYFSLTGKEYLIFISVVAVVFFLGFKQR